jgi:hypothetical protein
MEQVMENVDAWMKTQKDYMENWAKSQKEMMGSWSNGTKKFQESLSTMSGFQVGPAKEMITLYNSWLTTMVNSSNNFTQELEKMQEAWKNTVEEQMGISREIVKKMVELFKQGEKK